MYATARMTDGYLTKGRLESEGIPVLIKGEGNGPYGAGPMYLFVPEEFESEAREILKQIQESD